MQSINQSLSQAGSQSVNQTFISGNSDVHMRRLYERKKEKTEIKQQNSKRDIHTEALRTTANYIDKLSK